MPAIHMLHKPVEQPLSHRAGSAGGLHINRENNFTSLADLQQQNAVNDGRLSSRKHAGGNKHSNRKSSGKLFDRHWLILNQKSFIGEKGTAGRAQALFEKYERKVVDSYEKQIKKLESTYKAIFASLEAHKATQINQLRTLQL